jgi:GNAT superfamily N-acetyltransferase
MRVEIVTLDEQSKSSYGKKIQELENFASYPLGQDFFKINHGENYFAFFERLGEVTFRVALHEERVVACAAGVLRSLPLNGKLINAWYLCDLKVHPDYLGKRIPSKLFRKSLIAHYLKCGRGYAISMNPPIGENRIVRLLDRFSWVPFRLSKQINFYNLSYPKLLLFIERNNLKSQSFLDLRNKKDLVIASTGQTMKLLHFQHGQFAEKDCIGPQPDYIHMYCAVVDSDLDKLLSKDFKPDASASIISHRMDHFDWSFILSSDI